MLGTRGDGLGEGDDYRVSARDIEDQLHHVSRPPAGSFTLTARITAAHGPLTGLMLRDAGTHLVHGQVSPDGTAWVTAATLFTSFPYALHAGFAATGDAEFSQVAVGVAAGTG
ncbi:Ig-like domain-containing protein [Streptomyces sp. NPDC017991]|uniref:Ig-like domain-containing protein n=1 Tax=Streptomyces sp. NPDC017991 TaxID=3365026 RepID=UPI0037B2FA88